MRGKIAAPRRSSKDKRGSVALLTGLLLVSLLGFAAISIDTGYLVYVQNRLQASSNMAAMAGALYFTSGTASSAALTYSAQAGAKNALPAQSVTAAVTLRCVASVANMTDGPVPCTAYGSQPAANSVQVTQTATVTTFFARVLGFSTVTLAASASSIPQGSNPLPLNVAIILDTTASMNTNDSSCGSTRLQCALSGVRTLLGQLAPSVDQVSLFTFPGVKNAAQASLDYDCLSSTSPQIAAYNASPVYGIVTASADYRTGSPPAKTLNTSSNLSKAVGAGASGCAAMSAVGGVGTYYADAITAAQSALAASHQTGQQNMIIILTDGDASSSAVGPSQATNQCHKAITAAQTAVNAGTWVYAIAYGASTNAFGSCGADTPRISACSTLQQIASDSSKFYSDAPSVCVSVNPQSSLSSIFAGIAGSLSKARLIPNGAS
jgi:Flp pilus assembly protein TadG